VLVTRIIRADAYVYCSTHCGLWRTALSTTNGVRRTVSRTRSFWTSQSEIWSADSRAIWPDFANLQWINDTSLCVGKFHPNIHMWSPCMNALKGVIPDASKNLTNKLPVTRKRCDLEQTLILFTTRKSYTSFRLLPKYLDLWTASLYVLRRDLLVYIMWCHLHFVVCIVCSLHFMVYMVDLLNWHRMLNLAKSPEMIFAAIEWHKWMQFFTVSVGLQWRQACNSAHTKITCLLYSVCIQCWEIYKRSILLNTACIYAETSFLVTFNSVRSGTCIYNMAYEWDKCYQYKCGILANKAKM